MSTEAIDKLLSLVETEDPFDYRVEDIRPVQFAAATARLKRAVAESPIVARRAADARIEEIGSLADIVPLFLTDQTYKSYPATVVANRRWSVLGRWLDSLSIGPSVLDVDVEGAEDLDEWLTRLRAAGHVVYVSSGTSGKCSLYQVNEFDQEFDRKMWHLSWRWTTGERPANQFAAFAGYPHRGWHRLMDTFGRVVADFGRPDETYYMSNEPLRISDVNALAQLRQSMAAGTASPSDVKDFERRSAGQSEKMAASLQRQAEELVAHRSEPLLLIGSWAPLYSMVTAAEANGLAGGVHPESIVFAGGGLKGVKLPDDYEERLRSILGLDPSRYLFAYGFSELPTLLPACRERRYHSPPWMIPIVVDQLGERLAEVDEHGQVTGRLGFFDVSLDGHWGAMITGDHGTLSTRPCPCGRAGPTIEDTVVRYTDLPGGDDRVSCAGTIDSYVNGLLSEGEE